MTEEKDKTVAQIIGRKRLYSLIVVILIFQYIFVYLGLGKSADDIWGIVYYYPMGILMAAFMFSDLTASREKTP